MYLLDTNVFRHLDDEAAHPNVQKWLHSVNDRDLLVSVISVRESRKGAERLRRKKPAVAEEISAKLDKMVALMSERFIPIDPEIA